MRASIINMEMEYQKDMHNGLGIEIDTPIPVDKKEMLRNPRGIYSSLFGGDISDIEELQKRYSCQCGEVTGKFKEGLLCEKCGTPVTFHDDELERTGWMTLDDPYVLITPRMYKFLESAIRPKILDEIINFNHRLDANGNIIYNDMDPTSKNPYANIGILEFQRRFDEILDKMGKSDKLKEIEFLKLHRSNVFTKRVPVLNLALRPVVLIAGTTFNYDPINMYYSEMMSHIHYINNNVNNAQTQSNLNILYELQKKWVALDKEIVAQKINGKKHTIRSFILGSRINFSARQVIIAENDSVKMTGVRVPYLTFCEFFKFHMMNIYKKIYRITVNELQDRWYTLVASQDPSIMHIIDLMIKRSNGGLRLLVNRNPTIALGSIQCLTITGIYPDIHDLVMALPLTILGLMNADFDGDVLSIVPMIDVDFANKFERFFSPERLIISAATGRYNRKISLIKDQLVGLYSFCNDPFIPEDFNCKEDKFSIITPQMLMARDEYYKQKVLANNQNNIVA
jgi:hypothetical protein